MVSTKTVVLCIYQHINKNTNYCMSLFITQSFYLPKNPKNLDPSQKTDLDLWDYLERVNLLL